MNKNEKKKSTTQENPLVSLLINVVIPYLILTKLDDYLGERGPTWALFVALSLPLIYGLSDYFKNARTNYISIFGILNTLFTGGFAILELSSTWFIVKEAAFPFLLGVIVLFSSFSKKPVIKFMFNFSHVLDMDKIHRRLAENNTQERYEDLLLKTNNLFALSFFISSFLNFLLAYWVFKDIDPTLSDKVRTEALNQQIADMWWMGYVVIALPLTGFLMFILYKLIHGLKVLTGLDFEQIVIQK